MRVIVRRWEGLTSHIFAPSSRPLGKHGFLSHQLPSSQGSRSFATSTPLAASDHCKQRNHHAGRAGDLPHGIQNDDACQIAIIKGLEDAQQSSSDLEILARDAQNYGAPTIAETPNRQDAQGSPFFDAYIDPRMRNPPTDEYHTIVSADQDLNGASGDGELQMHHAGKQAALRAEFNSIMETAQPDQVMAALLDPAYKELVASMPQSAFVEALHLLSPDYFVEPYKAVYAPLHPHSTEVKMHRSLELIFDDFARNLSAIIRGRRSAGHKLGLAEYTHLLDCARSSGDALMADYVWHAMKKDKVVPDIRCYNHYMEVKVWNRSYSGLEKFRLRVTPFSYRRRRFQDPGWQGYGTARYSVRKEVREIFDEMTQAGYEGNEASIVSLFMASARVGHVPGMKKILKTVWNVDVNALNAGVRDPVAEHDRSSPLHPTDHLLYAVAHGFSTNNDIASALKIIEHISDSYDLVVPSRVWRELFERSFVLSRPRYGSEVKRDTKGKVTFDFVKGLFETMVQEPFNIVPTVDMLSKMARNAWSSRKLVDYLHHMRAAYKILDETRRKRHAARTMVESYFLAPRLGNKQLDPRVLRSRGFADAVHAYGILRLHVMQQTVLMERLARKLVTRGNWTPDSPYWDRMGLPRALEEWRDFLPQHFDCRARNYNITFEGSTHFGAAWYPAHSKFQVRRPSLNDEFTLDETANEREDDFFWNRWRDNMHEDDLSFPLLKRIFDPMRPDLDLVNLVSDGQGQEMAYDAAPEPTEDEDTESSYWTRMENSFRSASMRPSKGLREAASKRLKEGEFSWTFGKLGEPDPA